MFIIPILWCVFNICTKEFVTKIINKTHTGALVRRKIGISVAHSLGVWVSKINIYQTRINCHSSTVTNVNNII